MFIDYLHIAKQAELEPPAKARHVHEGDYTKSRMLYRVTRLREMRCACANRRAAVSIMPQP